MKDTSRCDEHAVIRGPATLRIVALRDGKEPYSVAIPVKDGKLSIVLPNGYINWPAGKPYPDSMKVSLGENGEMWVNFGFSREFGFYVSIKGNGRRHLLHAK
ncbi:MAG: hypothetical protein QXG10_02075 [Candidatus Hadarchaeales archaeon]